MDTESIKVHCVSKDFLNILNGKTFDLGSYNCHIKI